jgi:hypothetical protein
VDVGNTDRTLLLRFGAQTDTKVIRSGTETALGRNAVANYIAKYATKDSAVPGMPDYRLRSAADLMTLHCPPHTRRMIETAWGLGYRRWAHPLGRGGHFFTKSRRFSVTYGQLRGERIAHRRAQRHPDGELDPWGRIVDETTVVMIGGWSYAGSGFQAADAHALALMSADNARKN